MVSRFVSKTDGNLYAASAGGDFSSEANPVRCDCLNQLKSAEASYGVLVSLILQTLHQYLLIDLQYILLGSRRLDLTHCNDFID